MLIACFVSAQLFEYCLLFLSLQWKYNSTSGTWKPQDDNPLGEKTPSALASDYGITVAGTPSSDERLYVTISSGTNSGFWLGADGIFKCRDAEISGAITANTFKFNNVNMKWRFYEVGYNSVSGIDLQTDLGAERGDFVVVSWGYVIDDYPVSMNSFSFILEDGARTFADVTETLINVNGVKFEYARGTGVQIQPAVALGMIVTTNKTVDVAVQVYHKTT